MPTSNCDNCGEAKTIPNCRQKTREGYTFCKRQNVAEIGLGKITWGRFLRTFILQVRTRRAGTVLGILLQAGHQHTFRFFLTDKIPIFAKAAVLMIIIIKKNESAYKSSTSLAWLP